MSTEKVEPSTDWFTWYRLSLPRHQICRETVRRRRDDSDCPRDTSYNAGGSITKPHKVAIYILTGICMIQSMSAGEPSLPTLYSWMTPASSRSEGGFQATRMAVPLASLFVTVTPWGALLGAKTMKHRVKHADINMICCCVRPRYGFVTGLHTKNSNTWLFLVIQIYKN